MANYKDTVFQNDPTSFWSFDFDRQSTLPQIIDEVDNTNPGIMQGDGYEILRPSLVSLEQTDQYSVIINEIEKVNDSWAHKTWLEVPTSPSYIFDDFTVEMLYYKNRPNKIKYYGEPGFNKTIKCPLAYKDGLAYLYLWDVSYNSSDNGIGLNLFDGQFIIEVQNSTAVPIWYRTNHVAFSYHVEETDLQEYLCTAKLYLNGRKIGEQSKTYYGSPPNTNVSDSWLFGATRGDVVYDDWNRERLSLDQISIYDKVLNETFISDHYKRTRRYDELITTNSPKYYWRFDDRIVTDNYIRPTVGDITGLSYPSISRFEPGPEQIKDSQSTRYYNNGTGEFHKYNYTTVIPMMNVASDYTVEFWFKSDSAKRGALFSCVEDYSYWSGLSIFLNSSNKEYSSGSIEVYESSDQYITISGEYNDNEWHHIAVVREGNNWQVYLDGMLMGTNNYGKQTTQGKMSHIFIMGSSQSDNVIPASISELAIYEYPLQQEQIYIRYNYRVKHRVYGYTLLEGNPVSAKVIFYDTETGEKVGETISNDQTGYYEYFPYTNRRLDLLAKIPNNKSIRYRVHGPITPTSFDDNF